MTIDEKKQHFLNCIKDCVGNLFYYDRKEDETLNVSELNELIDSGDITLEEIVNVFSIVISTNFHNIKIK